MSVSETPEFKVILASAQTGQLLGEIAPKNLDSTLYLSDVGYCNFDLNMAHPLAERSFIEPYATDWILMHKEHHITGGIVTQVGIDLEQEWLQVACLDYAHYLDKRFYPTMFFNSQGDLQVNSIGWVQQDIFQVLGDILDETLSEDGSLDLMYALGSSGTLINYRIEPGDTETVLEKIRDLAEQDPGFDWRMHTSIENGMIMKELQVGSPTLTEEKDYVFQQGKNLGALSYIDHGISATDVYALGAGTARKVAGYASDPALRQKYRRLDHSIDLGDIIDKKVVRRQATAELEKIKNSTRGDLKAKVIPEANFDIWSEIFVGDTVRVIGETEYEPIDDMCRIVSFQITPTDTGDEEVEVVFENAV